MSISSCLCPSCRRQLSVSPKLLGKTVRCPSCGKAFRLQSREKTQEVIAARHEAVEAASSVKTPTGENEPIIRLSKRQVKRRYGYLLMGFVVVLLAAGALGYSLIRRTSLPTENEGKPEAAKPLPLSAAPTSMDRDYFAIQELNYEIIAICEIANAFGIEFKRRPDFSGKTLTITEMGSAELACLQVNIICNETCDLIDPVQLKHKKKIVHTYHVEVAEARSSFHKRFPEWDVIKEEVRQMVRNDVREKLAFVWMPSLLKEYQRLLNLGPNGITREQLLTVA